jgi:Trm5-related predicted tRNA methylase
MTSNEQEVRIANLTAERDGLKRQLAEALQTIREAIFERDHAITALAKFKARVQGVIDSALGSEEASELQPDIFELLNNLSNDCTKQLRDCAPAVPSAPGSGEVKDGAK